MPSLFKRTSGIYYIVHTVDGKRKWKSTGETEKYRAINKLLNFNKLISQPTKRLLLSDFINDFLFSATTNFSPGTIAIYKRALTNFKSAIGDRQLISITPKHIDVYKTDRSRNLSPVTLNIELRTLRAAFYTAIRWKILSENPFRSVQLMKIPDQQPLFLTKDEFTKLLSVVSDLWFKDLIVIAVCTGLRRGELLNLLWKDIDFQRKIIHIHSSANFRTKFGKRRTVPMNDASLRLLTRRFQGTNCEFVFSRNGRQILVNTVTQKFKKCVKKAGINEELHFHSLRHTFATWLVQNGVSLYEVQKLLGHSSITVTQVYSHLQPETLHPTVNRISIPMN